MKGTPRLDNRRRNKAGVLLDSGSNVHLVDRGLVDQMELMRIGMLENRLKILSGITDPRHSTSVP